jgi:predicted permease
VVGQVAVSLVLLAGAGLLVRSLGDLQKTEMGLAREELLIVKVDANPLGYEGERLHSLQRQLAERFRSIPGVLDVSYSQNGLFSGIEAGASVETGDGPASPEAEGTSAFDRVGPDYFRAIGARMLRGRGIEERDGAGSAPVVVINQTLARIHFGNENPVGQDLRVDENQYQIVGVVADVTGHSMRATPQRRFYTALAQGDPPALVVYELRTRGDPAGIARTVRDEAAAVHSLLRVGSTEPLTSLMQESLGLERIAAGLAGVAGALALALAALGLYGVMTYTIVRRTRELGVRMALGARPDDLTRMVLRESLTLVLFGALLGIPAAIAAAAFLRSQLAGISLVDPASLAIALAVLAGTAALAGYSPARRAARVEPRTALSSD